MKDLKRALILSLILHLLGVGLLGARFSPSKEETVVRVKLVALRSPVPQPSPSPASRTPSQSSISRPRKSSQKPPRRVSRPKKSKKLAQKKPRQVSRINSSPPSPDPRTEEILRKKLASLQEEVLLRERLQRLKKKQSGTSANTQADLPEGYIALLRTYLKRYYQVPLILKGRRNLEAIIRLKLAANGELLEYQLLRPSGEPLFDQAVEAAVKAAAPYPSPGTPVTIRVIFTPQGLRI